MKNISCFIILLFLLPGLPGWSQQQPQSQPDSVYYQTPDSSEVYFFTLNDVYFDSVELEHIDTSLYRHEVYDPVQRKTMPYHRLGNLGLAHQPLHFNIPDQSGFQLGMSGFDTYLFTYDQIPYYKLWNPYTKLYYVQGPEEQLFSGDHSQRVMKNLTLGLQFRFIKSLGAYIRQKAQHNSAAAKARYQTNDKRYSVLANYVYNKLNAEENGGIANDSLFVNNVETERNLFEVQLGERDHQALSRVRHSGFYLHQAYYLSPLRNEPHDSIDTLGMEKKKPKLSFSLGKLSHTFHYHRTAHMYWDKDTTISYYRNFYIDTDNRYDSIYYHKLTNEFSWSNGRIDSAKQAFKIRFGLRHDLVKLYYDRGFESRYTGNENDTLLADPLKKFSQFTPSAQIRLQLLPKLSVSARGNLVFGEVYNQGDVHLNGEIALTDFLRKNDRATGNLTLARQDPAWLLNEYSSNHFQWNTNFKKQDILRAGVTYRNKNWYAGLDYYLVNNYAFLGADTLPEQFTGELSVIRADLRSHHRLGRFTLDNRLIYHQTPQKDIIHIPDLVAKTSLRFNLSLFNNALHTQTGFSVFYATSYYGDAYVPALHSFHLQNYQETGNHPYADVFINLKIKRTRFFFKMSHVNGGFPEYNYFYSPHYPLRDREFRFGLDWKFYD